jgi:hypothetical protein
MYMLTIFMSPYDETRAACLERAINEMAQYAEDLKRFPPGKTVRITASGTHKS